MFLHCGSQCRRRACSDSSCLWVSLFAVAHGLSFSTWYGVCIGSLLPKSSFKCFPIAALYPRRSCARSQSQCDQPVWLGVSFECISASMSLNQRTCDKRICKITGSGRDCRIIGRRSLRGSSSRLTYFLSSSRFFGGLGGGSFDLPLYQLKLIF
jgi:hypothetical protein